MIGYLLRVAALVAVVGTVGTLTVSFSYFIASVITQVLYVMLVFG